MRTRKVEADIKSRLLQSFNNQPLVPAEIEGDWTWEDWINVGYVKEPASNDHVIVQIAQHYLDNNRCHRPARISIRDDQKTKYKI